METVEQYFEQKFGNKLKATDSWVIRFAEDYHNHVSLPVVEKTAVDDDFLKYIKDERLNVSKSLMLDWLSLSPKERVAIENLLIAYDQMADRLTSLQGKGEEQTKEACQEEVECDNHSWSEGFGKGGKFFECVRCGKKEVI